jgi:hypothetical protein
MKSTYDVESWYVASRLVISCNTSSWITITAPLDQMLVGISDSVTEITHIAHRSAVQVHQLETVFPCPLVQMYISWPGNFDFVFNNNSRASCTERGTAVTDIVCKDWIDDIETRKLEKRIAVQAKGLRDLITLCHDRLCILGAVTEVYACISKLDMDGKIPHGVGRAIDASAEPNWLLIPSAHSTRDRS